MRGVISFHPVDMAFFDELLQPLLAGEKVNPESWLERALRVHESAACAARYVDVLESLLAALEPPPPPSTGTLWEKIRGRLERLEYRPQRISVIVSQSVEPDLHLEGRPFFITEGSADRVGVIADEYCGARTQAEAEALVLEQLVRLDKELGRELAQHVDAEDGRRGPASITVRRDLLNDLKRVHDLTRAVDGGATLAAPGRNGQSPEQTLAQELPWQAMRLASRAVPFWVGRDVDGLETVCKAAGIEPPDCLVPAYRLFGDACERYPELAAALHTELREGRDIGGFVPAESVADLCEFLNREGARIIRAATQAGEAETCTLLLRKIRECARYAESHGMGYLEAAGIPPLFRSDATRS